MAAYQPLLNWGEVHVPAGTASLLVAIAPVFSVLLAAAFLGEKLRARTVLGSVIAIAGAAVIAVAGGKTGVSLSALVVLAAALVQGVYHFASKPLLARYTGMEVACYAMWTGTMLLIPFAPDALGRLGHAPGSAVGAAIYLGLLPSALGFVVWGYALARFTVAVSTAALYLVPPVTLLVAFVWLGEVPLPVELVGGLISIAGVVLINARRSGSKLRVHEHVAALAVDGLPAAQQTLAFVAGSLSGLPRAGVPGLDVEFEPGDLGQGKAPFGDRAQRRPGNAAPARAGQDPVADAGSAVPDVVQPQPDLANGPVGFPLGDGEGVAGAGFGPTVLAQDEGARLDQ
jgi:drug/metabolite transporter (DMT)-like permease